MVFFIDDILLRTIGLSIPPFDMIWLIETLEEYARETLEEETKKATLKNLKENRLLYELGEITLKEYERKNEKLNQRMKDIKRANQMNLEQRVSLLRHL